MRRLIFFFAFLFSMPLAQANVKESILTLDQIEVKGAKAFPPEVLKNVLEFSPGDSLERSKMVRSIEGLQSLYRVHGFEEVRIESRLVRKKLGDKRVATVLEFDVNEGKPIRVAAVEIVPYGVGSEDLKKDWREKTLKIKQGVSFAAGDILDQEKIRDGKRNIQELLASDEYIGSKVEDVRIAEAEPLSLGEASRWVKLEFHISLGEKVSFGFRGNTFFTTAVLNGLVKEQRVLGLGSNYIGVVRSRIIEEYRNSGFANVEISPMTTEIPEKDERKVTLVIDEGQRIKIDAIHFDGNSVFSDQDLQERFYSKASSLVRHDIYVEKDIQKAAELLIESLEEQGYLSAKLVNTNTAFVSTSRFRKSKNAAVITFYLYEGDQTLIQNVTLKGLTVLPAEDLKKILKVKEGAPLNLFSFGEGIERLKKAYSNRGYLDFKILNEGTEDVVKYSQENRIADIFLDLEEGPQYRVSKIEIEGLGTTKKQVVQRELRFREGEVLKEDEIEETERSLRRLGIFSEVSIRMGEDTQQPGYKVIWVHVHEAEGGMISGGPGYRNDLGLRLFGQLSYTNLWGENHTLALSVSGNRRLTNYNFLEGQVQLAYVWPWFLAPDLTFRPTLSLAQNQFINFSSTSVSAATLWDRPLLIRPNLGSSFSYSVERIRQFNAMNSSDNQTMQIATVSPKLTLDMRDNPLLPSKGFFFSSGLDLSLPYLGSQSEIGFYRVLLRGDYYLSLFNDIVWFLSLRTAYERNLEKEGSLPLSKQFTMGGTNSIRGYVEQELNKELNETYNSITGSLAYFNFRTQVDFPFSGAAKLGLFFDGGNLLVNRYSLTEGLRYGVGAGLHFQTPVGAVNLDWGFKIDPPAESDPYVIHFSVGVI